MVAVTCNPCLLVVCLALDPIALCERQDLAAIKPPAGGKIDIFDAGVGEAHLRVAKPVGEALVGAGCGFPVEHEPQPFIALKGLTWIVFGQSLPSVYAPLRVHRSNARRPTIIATSNLLVLRRPVEFAQYTSEPFQ